MKRIFTLFKSIILSGALLFLSHNLIAQNWTIYDGTVLPSSATPAWTTGDVGTPPASYSITSDGYLYETTTASGDKQSFKLAGTQPTAATWLIRVKAGNNDVSTEFELNSAGPYRIYFRLINYKKGGYLKTNYLVTNITYPSDSTLDVKAFHTYRLTVESGNSYKIYLDENPAPIVTGTCTTTSSNSQFLRFGDVGGNFTEGYIDWMAWDATGAYAPGTTLPTGVTVDTYTPTGVKDINSIENAEIKSTEYFSLTGVRIGDKYKTLKPGMYLQKVTYTNGVVKSSKIFKDKM
jgi:hypothetical protein